MRETETKFDGDRSPISQFSVDKQQTNTEWVTAKTRGRWAPFWNPATRTYNPPPSEARKKARRQKYAWQRLQNPTLPDYVPLHLCMTGDELLAERSRIRGDGTSFRVPRTDEARELVALLPHGRLRLVEALALVAIAYAMLERRRHGLVATIDELGEFLGLQTTATGEVMARLIALGFVRADATYTRYGACESQRGNLWRLTAQCVEAFALRGVPAGIVLPTGTVDRARLGRRRRSPGIARACATPRNPEANPDPLRKPVNNSESFRNGTRTDEARDAVSASPTGSIVTVPADRHLPSQPARRQGETCESALRLRTEGGSNAAPVERIGDALERVRRGQVHERRRVDSDTLPRRRPLRDDERIAERELERVRGEHVRDVAGDERMNPPRPRRKTDEEQTAELIESLCRLRGWAPAEVALRELKGGGAS